MQRTVRIENIRRSEHDVIKLYRYYDQSGTESSRGEGRSPGIGTVDVDLAPARYRFAGRDPGPKNSFRGNRSVALRVIDVIEKTYLAGIFVMAGRRVERR